MLKYVSFKANGLIRAVFTIPFTDLLYIPFNNKSQTTDNYVFSFDVCTGPRTGPSTEVYTDTGVLYNRGDHH